MCADLCCASRLTVVLASVVFATVFVLTAQPSVNPFLDSAARHLLHAQNLECKWQRAHARRERFPEAQAGRDGGGELSSPPRRRGKCKGRCTVALEHICLSARPQAVFAQVTGIAEAEKGTYDAASRTVTLKTSEKICNAAKVR